MNSSELNRELVRILRLSEVLRRTGLSRSSLYLNIQKRAFPEQISLGLRSVGWLENEVNDWIANRINSSRRRITNPP